jgi:hypothetical protein
LFQLLRVKMMSEKVATHQVECPIGERKSERIADDAALPRRMTSYPVTPGEMTPRNVQQSQVQRDSALSQSLPDNLG